MNKITNKTLKRIKAGFHDDLMDAIEFLIDSYEEDKFEAGYKSCLEDLSVRSHLLADYIVKHTTMGDKDATKDDFTTCAVNDLAKVIEDYYTKALKQ